MDYLFPSMVALTAEGEVLRSGVGQIFAEADTAYANPLTVYDLAGVPQTTISIDSLGITEAFRAAVPVVVWKSGEFILPVWSATGMLADVQASRDAAESSAADAAASAAAVQAMTSGGGLLTQTAADQRYVERADFEAANANAASNLADVTLAVSDAYQLAEQASAFALKGVVLDDGAEIPDSLPAGALVLYRVAE